MAVIDNLLFRFATEAPLWVHIAVFFCVGLFTGSFLATCMVRLPDSASLWPPPACRTCGTALRLAERIPLLGPWIGGGHCRDCGQPAGFRVLLTQAGTGLVFAIYVAAVLHFRAQEIPEGGHIHWIQWRVLYHLILLCLLIVATGIDFELYIIPDSITLTGMAIGLAGAAWAGNLQLVPLWVDWNVEVAHLLGPYIPDWIKQHHHWHGLAWSAAGLVAGGAITWLVRIVSSLIVGRESLGFGDVTLMAMIGSFMGWQPVVMVFLLAPLCGVAIGLTLRLCSGRTALPYGPYLSAAAAVVLVSWRWLWTPTRIIFGHWQTLAMLFGAVLAGLVVLLGALRLYRMIPVRGRGESGRVDFSPPEDES